MGDDKKRENPFLNPNFLEEDRERQEEELRQLALQMTRDGSLTIFGSGSLGVPGRRAINPITGVQFVQRHNQEARGRLDEEAREVARYTRLFVGGAIRPLSITDISPAKKNDYEKPLDISYRAEQRASTSLEWDANRKWNCAFCGTVTKTHRWASFDTHDPSGQTARKVPEHCTLHLLLDQLGHDFFPGSRVILDSQASHLHNPKFIKFVFRQINEHSEKMSSTWIDLQYEKPSTHDSPMVRSMNIDMQLQRIRAWTLNCEKSHPMCKREISDIPAKRVLDLKLASNGLLRLMEPKNIKKPYIALSHCWGDPSQRPPMTTHANLLDHESGILLSDLPKSFSDTVKVCIAMKIQYLWIDCLCIVQDDE
jgi:hypothetical protein